MLAQRWNTRDVNSITTDVLLPEALAISGVVVMERYGCVALLMGIVWRPFESFLLRSEPW